MTIDYCIRDVVGYEGKYKINIVGEVFNKKGKQLKPCVDKFGYLKCCLYDGKPHQKKIHRMVAEAFIPNPLNKEQVNHIDGNKKNNNSENLEWCTNSMNQVHAYSHNLNQGARGKGIIVGVTYPNEDYVEYPSIKKAAQALGVNPVTIKIKIIGIKPSIKLVGYKFTLIRTRRYTDRCMYQKYGINEMGDRYE